MGKEFTSGHHHQIDWEIKAAKEAAAQDDASADAPRDAQSKLQSAMGRTAATIDSSTPVAPEVEGAPHQAPAPEASPRKSIRGKWRSALSFSKKQAAEEEETAKPSEDFIKEALVYREQLARIRREKRFIFRPGESPFLNVWDAIGITVLTYTALFTPFEVAFLTGFSDTSAWTAPRFLIARFIDVYFTCDLCLQFVVAYKQLDVSKDGHRNGTWVEDHKSIAIHYLTNWSPFDELSPHFPLT